MRKRHASTIGVSGAALVLALGLTACGDAEPPSDRPASDVLRDVWVFPLSVPVSYTGTGEAMQTTWSSGYAPDTVAAWYRRTLVQQGWEIVGDTRTPDGQITLHAERDGPPVWIIIGPRTSPPGTVYTMIGAEPDTTHREP
jgi:hypothetical protein